MSASNYIKKHYSILTYGFFILFVIALVVSIVLTFDKGKTDITVGIIILLFSDLILAIMSLVSMVAMFSEVSRLHAREFPKDAIDQMGEINNKINKIDNVIAIISKIEECCESVKKSIANQNGVDTSPNKQDEQSKIIPSMVPGVGTTGTN